MTQFRKNLQIRGLKPGALEPHTAFLALHCGSLALRENANSLNKYQVCSFGLFIFVKVLSFFLDC